ncbi:hypothetical protein PLUTE_a4889 [Pseudoalteromonas luteoviolacea DSM 6061]|nr:hypothetical protein [Pseudoalteromonas luteoviolacea DSM 6061]
MNKLGLLCMLSKYLGCVQLAGIKMLIALESLEIKGLNY